MSQFIAVIRTFKYHSPRGLATEVQMTSLEILHVDGRDCGVPLYVSGYDEASQLLKLAGASARELDEKRQEFDRSHEVRICLSADSGTLQAIGFNPHTEVPGQMV